MIVITSADSVDNEIEIIHQLFEEGLPLLHVRKPNANRDQIKRFLESIKQEYHLQLVLHQHYDLANEYAVKRLHFTETTRPDLDEIVNSLNKKKDWIFSISTHTINGFNGLSDSFQYAFLSPVYNSISKPGYKSDGKVIDSLTLRTNTTTKLVALGGIDRSNYNQTIAAGFDDAALLGCIWNADDPVKEFKNALKQLMHYE